MNCARKKIDDSRTTCRAGNDDRDICYFRAFGDEKSFTTKICSEGLLGHVDASPEACCKWTLVCTQTQLGWTSVNCARTKIDDSQT